MSQVPQPGPWARYCDFRLAFEVGDLLAEQRRSVQAYCCNLVKKFPRGSAEFRFDEQGWLQSRERDIRPNAEMIGISPRRVFESLRRELRMLGTSPVPPLV